MIIDSHAHVVMTDDLYRYMGELVASRANPAGPFAGVGEKALQEVSRRLLSIMDGVGTDIQFLSPRPYMMMHSIKPGRSESPAGCLDELERCINELGFVGCLINPDPTEGEEAPPPGL